MTARNKNIPALRFKDFKDNWKEVKLGEGIDLISGLHLSPEDYNKNKSGMPYFTGPSDFTNDDSKVTKWSLNSTNYGLKKDVLFTVKGSGVGTMSLLGLEKVAIGRQLMAIRSRKFDSEFVYHFLFKKSNYFVALASGNMIPGLTRQDILTLKLDIPSLPEQQKIAPFLSAIDEKIRQLTRRKELLEQYKKGVMQQLFSGKLRFKDEKGKVYPKWEETHGNLIFESISDKNHNSDLPILAITQEHGAIPRDLIEYKVTVTDKSIETYKVVQVGDFIISLRSFQGGIEYSNYKGICSPAYNILRPILKINSFFYKYYFKTEYYIKQLNKNLEGIRDGKMISYKYFSEIKLPLPSLEEQNDIVDFLSSIDTKIESVTAQIERTQGYKKGLLQKMFV
jgi:type I restriction enzyme, S subunit